jgi:flagellar basal body P-ring protein FlgI
MTNFENSVSDLKYLYTKIKEHREVGKQLKIELWKNEMNIYLKFKHFKNAGNIVDEETAKFMKKIDKKVEKKINKPPKKPKIETN